MGLRWYIVDMSLIYHHKSPIYYPELTLFLEKIQTILTFCSLVS